MATMQPSAPRDVRQGVHNSMKEVANEPSVGLCFVQQHVNKVVPGLLSLKDVCANTLFSMGYLPFIICALLVSWRKKQWRS